MHIGLARTALFNYLFAKQNGGSFILRIEDTDKARSKPEYEKIIIDGFAWLGLSYDTFFRQSKHLSRHKEMLEMLVQNGTAYISKEEAKDGSGRTVEVVRLKNAGKRVTFQDKVRGEVSFDTTELGDFVIARSMDDPLYHLAVVVDDHDEGVTHIIRAEEHLSNTPRQILIHEALGFPIPEYAHIPLILAPDRTKLSKRKGTAVAITDYRERGFLPEAILNYLALLGWSAKDDRELFTLTELIEAFDFDNVQKSGAIFSTEKLAWFNKQYLGKKSAEEQRAYTLEAISSPALHEVFARSPAALSDLLERVSTSGEIKDMEEAGEFAFFIEKPVLDPALLVWKKEPDSLRTKVHLEKVAALLSSLDATDFFKTRIMETILPYAEEAGKGSVLWPLRYALTGRERSPDPFTVAEAIGREETILRITSAMFLL